MLSVRLLVYCHNYSLILNSADQSIGQHVRAKPIPVYHMASPAQFNPLPPFLFKTKNIVHSILCKLCQRVVLCATLSDSVSSVCCACRKEWSRACCVCGRLATLA